MPGQITVVELEKAARNLERLAQFLGERRGWELAPDARDAASSVRSAARSLAALLAEMAGEEAPDTRQLELPPELEPSNIVSEARLAKFGEFIGQLRDWFASHRDSRLPTDSDGSLRSTHRSLALIGRAVAQLMGPEAAPGTASQAVLGSGLGPVAGIDRTARLVLEDNAETPLVQVFKGVSELNPEAKKMIEEFFANQGVPLAGNDRRRILDKILRWLQSTPEGQVLVIKLSGLSGSAEAYSSYQPKKQ